MELPHIGEHCFVPLCKKLDFLPLKCDSCDNVFCANHAGYSSHNCPGAYVHDFVVPACPLCGTPVPFTRGQEPDIAVGAHIDRDCQADPAKDRRKVFNNKCSLKGCKTKELIPVVCLECQYNFCLKHRHMADHKCEGKVAAIRKRAEQAALARANKANISVKNANYNVVATPPLSSAQGTMSDDEALARAIALSLQDIPGTCGASSELSQEQSDAMLAHALSESLAQAGGPTNSQGKDRCSLS